jgi:hypothetical protein
MLVGYVWVSKADGSQVANLQRDALRAAGIDFRHLYAVVAAGLLAALAGCGPTPTAGPTVGSGIAGPFTSGSVDWAGKAISYQAQGKNGVKVATRSRTAKCTVEVTVDGTEYKVEITKNAVETGGAKVAVEPFSKVEIRVDGDGLRVMVDGRQVPPKPKK